MRHVLDIFIFSGHRDYHRDYRRVAVASHCLNERGLNTKASRSFSLA